MVLGMGGKRQPEIGLAGLAKLKRVGGFLRNENGMEYRDGLGLRFSGCLDARSKGSLKMCSAEKAHFHLDELFQLARDAAAGNE